MEKTVKLDRCFLIPDSSFSIFAGCFSRTSRSNWAVYPAALAQLITPKESPSHSHPAPSSPKVGIQIPSNPPKHQLACSVITTLNFLDFCTVNENSRISSSPESDSSISSYLDGLLEHTNKTMVSQL